MRKYNYRKDISISMDESSMSEAERSNSIDSVVSIDTTQNNPFVTEYKNYFLIIASLIMVGGFYNCLFQGFIKNQFLESMGFSDNQYSTLVTVPHFPNIVLPILFGPLADIIGIRKGTFICVFVMLIGMTFIFISIIPQSFTLMLIGKILHQIGTENTHLCQSTIVSKWFKFSNLAFALAICSFVIKLSSSLSGIGYPYLFDQNNNLILPIGVGYALCILSFVSAIVIIIMDKKSEKFEDPYLTELNKQYITKKSKFSFQDIKQFDGLFWLVCLQIFMIWGSFYSFQNYGQSILINKFNFNQTEASAALSILFFVGMTSPFFGHFSDKYGDRAQVIIVLSCMCLVAFSLVLIAPSRNDDMKPIAYIFLGLFGTAISIGNAYIFPSIPLIADVKYIGTAFGICYAAKNAGTFTFSIVGGFALGENDRHFNHMLLLLFFSFIVQVGISIYTLYHDKKRKNLLAPPKIVESKRGQKADALSKQLV